MELGVLCASGITPPSPQTLVIHGAMMVWMSENWKSAIQNHPSWCEATICDGGLIVGSYLMLHYTKICTYLS